MYKIIDYVTYCFGKFIDILNIRFFDDLPITFLDVLLCAIILKAIIRFVFGGMREVDSTTNFMNRSIINNALLSNNSRKQQIVDGDIDIISGSFSYLRGSKVGYFSKDINISKNGSVTTSFTSYER